MNGLFTNLSDSQAVGLWRCVDVFAIYSNISINTTVVRKGGRVDSIFSILGGFFTGPDGLLYFFFNT